MTYTSEADTLESVAPKPDTDSSRGPAVPAGGYDSQSAALKPGASGYYEQAARLSPNGAGGDSKTPDSKDGESTARRELRLQLREARTDAERSAILQGASAIGVVGLVETSVDLGDGARVSTTTGELFIDGVGQIAGGFSAQEVISDEVSTRTRSAALAYTKKDGLTGQVVSETRLAGSEGDSITTRYEAGLEKGQATATASERVVATQDGVETTTGRSGSVGYGKKGVAVAAAADQTVKDELGSKAQSARIAYDQKDGLDAAAKQVDVVSAVEGESLTRTKEITHKKGETTVAASEAIETVNEDGTKVKSSRGATVGHGKDGVSAKATTEKSTALEFDGQTVEIKSGASIGYAKGKATAEAHDSTVVAEGDDKVTTVTKGNVSATDKGVIEGGFSGSEVVEDGVSKKTKTASAGYTEKDGFAAAVGSERTLSAVEGHEITDKRSLTHSKGQTTAAVGQSTKVVNEDGTKVATDAGAQVGYGKDGVTGAISASDVVEDDVSKTSRSANVGYGKDGFTANAKKSTELSAVENHKLTRTNEIGYSKGNATATVGEQSTYTDDDGAAHTSGRSNSLSVGKDGVTAGHQRTDTVKNADGTSAEKSAGVTANLSEGQFGGNVSSTQRDAEGKKTSSVHAAGTIDVSKDGRLEGVSGEVGAEKKGASVVIKGGYKYTLAPPKKVGNQWVVSMTVAQSAGAKVGGGKKVEGSLEGSASETRSETRHFKSKAEAQAFYESGPKAADVGPAVTADDALAMAEGDTASETDASSYGAGAKASVGGVTVGANIKIGDSHSVTVTRAKGGVVEVLVNDASMLGGGATVGAALVELGYSAEVSTAHSVHVRFDLNTSDGKTAFESFRRSGTVPRSGCSIKAVSDTITDKDEAKIGAGGATYTHGSTVVDRTTVDDKGKKTEQSEGTESLGLTVPLVGHYKTTDAIDVIETDDKTRTYQTTATVDASSASDASTALGRALNHEENPNASGKASGTWVVKSSFTEAQIQKLVTEIKAGRFNSATLIHHSKYGRAFEASVKGAGGDMDVVRKALAEFVANVGDRALDLIRDTIGGQFAYDYYLQGDKYLKGQAGTAAYQKTLADLKKRLSSSSSSASALVKDIDKALRAERTRRDYIADGSHYPELPRQLRAKEIGVSQDRIDELNKLKTRAVTRVTDERYEPAPDENENFTDPEVLTSEPPMEAPVCEMDPATEKVYADWDKLTAAKGRLIDKKKKWDSDYYAARRSEWVHGGAYSMGSAKDKLGWETWYGSGDYVADYKLVGSYMSKGRKLWKQGQTNERLATTAMDTLETQIACGDMDAGALQKAIAAAQALLLKAIQNYIDAASQFRCASSRYGQIEAENKDKAYLFVGYKHDMPKGQGL